MSTDDFFTLQNPVLGGLVLWAFVDGYERRSSDGKPPKLPLLLPVLPLVFNERCRKSIEHRNLKGGLFRALSDDRALPAGLEDRMREMVGQTLLSFRTACAAQLLEYAPATAEVRPLRKTLPPALKKGVANDMVGAARRLGTWFADLSPAQIALLLSIRF